MSEDVDVVVVGAGFAGMYLLHRVRGLGLSARVFEAGGDVGGTWYWNRYPGARCDIQSVDYSYSFDPDLDETWVWSEKYAAQPEILAYAQHVADRFDLRRSIQFDTRVASAGWDDKTSRWGVRTSNGEEIGCSYYVMATGCLSVPKEIDIEGTGRFTGEVYTTSRWPHDGVDLAGKRVAVIGTGSSAIQSIPIIAEQAAHVTVLQRTPNFAMPANNGPIPQSKIDALRAGHAEYRAAARLSGGGVPLEVPTQSALAVSAEERLETYENAWNNGGILEVASSYLDTMTSDTANELLAEFARGKIRAVVDDPETAELLCPYEYPIGSKRLCVDSGYYQTFNRSNVRLVDLRKQPIRTVVEGGIELVDETLDVDVLIFATGFDAMTGAMVSVDITGRGGRTLRGAWANGPMTYLGLMVAGFPNLFMVTGPGSPSVLSNMMVSIEQHVEWITDCIADMRSSAIVTIEPTTPAVEGWVSHVNDYAALTLYPQANSWYMGSNVPGKPRVFLPYCGGVARYRAVCDEVVSRDYFGFIRGRPDGTDACADGVIRRVQPDVTIMLEVLAELGIPAMDTLSVADARSLMMAMEAQRPAGPEVGEIVDSTLPGPAGDLDYRLYRPATPGPHPIVVYLHGGGWVLGSSTSDDPICRDLCRRSGTTVISVDYRHAPESPFPAAVDDAFSALEWIAANTIALGGIEGQLAVAGWSAGANLATVVCLLARDNGGPFIAGQLLINPALDGTRGQPSYTENAEGYILTRALMTWFWDHYAPPESRTDPRATPLRAASLADLPQAFIATSEFDPLRDEGAAYAKALTDAGVPVEHLACAGQIHTSLVAVDLIPSGTSARAAMGEAVRGFFL